MKINILTIGLIAAVFSCGSNSVEESSENSPIAKGKVTKSIKAGENSENSEIYYEYYVIDQESPRYEKSVNELICKILQTDFEGPDPEKIKSELSENYFSEILNEFSNQFLEVGEEFMPWNMMDSIHIEDKYSDFVHVEGFTYSFTGGAHGNGHESHTLIDKKTGEILSLSDVFSDINKLNVLVDKYFRKSVGIAANANYEDEGLFITGKLEANENFYFRDNKLVISYNAYEIGPYAFGAPSVEIPIDLIKDIIILNLK